MKQIPNIFTLFNLFLGCMAIALLLQNDFIAVYHNTSTCVGENAAPVTEFYDHNKPPHVWWASVFIFMAAIVDVLDGAVARFFNATSELGKQLDSLSDVVSFGVAPSMIMYQFMRMALMTQSNGMDMDIAYAFPAFILACAAAYRLAKFNVNKEEIAHFRGVPTPMVGLLVASMPLIYWYAPLPAVHEWLHKLWFLHSMVIVLSILMLMNVPMMSLKLKSWKPSSNIHLIILILIALGAFITISWLAVPVIFVSYIILSLIFKNKFS